MHCVTLLHKTYVHVRQYIALLFYIILWSEQKCVAGNIITSSTMYCLMSVCSCFVIIVMFYIFTTVTHSSTWRNGYGVPSSYFTDVVLHSSENYRQEGTTLLRRLSMEVAAACGAVN